MTKEMIEDVAIFCQCDGNVESKVVKKNVSEFLLTIFNPIIYEDIEREKDEDWTIDDLIRTIENKVKDI